jgi:putative transposase
VKKIKQYKSTILPIKTTKENINYLYQCNKESARVWNECIRLDKELWKDEQKHIERKYLQDNIKGNFSNILPSHNMQITIKKYMSAIKGIQKARKAGRNDEKYPWRFKKNYNAIWDSCSFKINYDNNTIKLSRPRSQNKIVNGKSKANPIILKFKTRLPP